MHRHTTQIGIGIILASAIPAMAQSDTALRALCEQLWEARMEHSPTWATSLGDYRYNDRLGDLSEKARTQWRLTLTKFAAEVEQLDTSGYGDEDQLTHTLLVRTLNDSLLGMTSDLHEMPLDPLGGVHIEFPLILVSQPFRDKADFEAYVKRIRAFPSQVSAMIDNMERGMQNGTVSPRVIVKKVIPQIRLHVVEDVTKSELYKPVAKVKNLPKSQQAEITKAIEDAIRESVVPAYRTLLHFVENEYLPLARDTVGIGATPRGKEIYRTRAYLNTTVHMKSDEIHNLGLSEVARIRREMASVQREVEFGGSLDDFLTHMRTDPSQRFTSGEELFQAAEAILNRTKPLMTKLFGRLPKTDCVMKEIEAFRAPASPVAYYNPSPEDGSRPGYYYINLYHPHERLRFTLEALSYHESVPGHHFQISLHKENKTLPAFRRHASFTAFVEGWALYTEKLGYEIGGYQDPYQRFGQLTFEMWRACRLVVDTGMHVQGWTRQRAIDYLTSNTSLALLDIESEIDRYIAWPGQALAYKIGELRILKIRRRAEEMLGKRFDLRAFHDALLAGGAMPLDLLEERMNRWMTETNN